MKKRILGLALLAMSMATIGANAQTNAGDNGNCPKTECSRSQQKCAKGDAMRLRNDAVFDKMNLSADQKAKLQALEQKKAEVRKAKAEARKSQKQQRCADACAAREAEKKQYLQDLKAIIGPENYVIFLEDYYVQDNIGKRVKAPHDRMARSHKDMKAKGNKGNKNSKGCCRTTDAPCSQNSNS